MEAILSVLQELGIPFQLQEHPATFTVEQSSKIHIDLDGYKVKNLFVKDKKKNYLLITLGKDKRADLKAIAAQQGLGRLSFCDAQELADYLGITPGSVSPLCIMADRDNKVTLLLDRDCKDRFILCHPLRNTATIRISYDDFLRFAGHFGHSVTLLDC